MGSKASYGALMGLGEGISEYGKTLSVEESRKQSDARTFDRQKSLQEISQQFRSGETDRKNEYDMDKITPGSDIYEAYEANRQKVRTEGTEDAIAIAEARANVYSGGSGKVMSQFNMSQWTPESSRMFLQEVQRLVTEEDMDEQEAMLVAGGTIELKPKPPSSSAESAGITKAVNVDLGIFNGQPKEGKIQLLVALLGEDQRSRLEAMTVVELLRLYKMEAYNAYSPPGAGLMNAAPGGTTPPGTGDVLNLGLPTG